ncbi:MFS transporter [Kineosporia babensis]|uniref:MFS transporter n=1 Tax=Kineosporia babensis TaxID=499548 RepID=A0A9X1T0K4_9ACTN|nr:MFS transporter [Kineosporia babensis]MCD5312838.1 MFS transporter [Kineosporia babensis]
MNPSRSHPSALAAYAAFAGMGVFWGTWGAALPALRSQAGLTEAQLGTALLFVGVGALPAMFLTGRLIDRLGLRLTAVLLGLLGAAGTVIAVGAQGYAAVVACMLLVGATSGATDVAINTLAGQVEHHTAQPLVTRAHGTFSLAVVVSSLSAGALLGGPGLTTTFTAALIAVLALCAFVWSGTTFTTPAPNPATRPNLPAASSSTPLADPRPTTRSQAPAAANPAAPSPVPEPAAHLDAPAAANPATPSLVPEPAAHLDAPAAANPATPSSVPEPATRSDASTAAIPATTSVDPGPATIIPKPLTLAAPLLLLGFIGALAYATENAHQSWGAVLITESFTASPQLASTAPATFAAAAALARLTLAPLSRSHPVQLLIAGGAAATVGSIVLATAPSIPVALLGLAIAALGTATLFPTLISYGLRTIDPARRGRATSTVATTAYLGFLLGPAYVGLIAHAATLRWAIIGIAALALIFTAVAAPASRWAGRRVQAPARQR